MSAKVTQILDDLLSNRVTSGPAGAAGASGIDCWDTDGNGLGDASEDVNGDGVFNGADCQVATGRDARIAAMEGDAAAMRAELAQIREALVRLTERVDPPKHGSR